jgi:c-di-GMP-related signal transduction protein
VEKFIARQPIFDSRRRVVAYELLFRSGPENFFSGVDGDAASKRMIDDGLHVFGIDALIGDARAFINVTKRVLLDDVITMLPKDRIVVEVLETVPAEPEVVAALHRLKTLGYMIALDDFVASEAMEPLLELADIVKVDFRETAPEERRRLCRALVVRGIKVLAEKVETEADVQEAQLLGCSYFQGYFFCKPEMIQRKDIPGFKLNYMRLLNELGRPQLDFASIERVLKGDMSLASKLLRYLNSAAFSWRTQITSLQHALALLGERPFRKWASLVAVANMSEDRPVELAMTSLIRARLCELLAAKVDKANELNGFLVGMFSLVDAIVGRPREEILKELAVPVPVSQALIDRKGTLALVLELVFAMERGSWEDIANYSSALAFDEHELPGLYRQSIQWVGEILGSIS